jgi:hypothetical protein
MKNESNLFISSLVGALLLAGGGCGGSPPPLTGSGGTSGAGGAGAGVPSNYIPLSSSTTGFVQDLIGGSNVIGPWYAYGDSVGPGANAANGDDHANSDCLKKGGFTQSDCSQIAAPTPGGVFMPTEAASSEMCTDGVASQVMNKGGAPDYSDMWGAGIMLDFSNPGGDAGPKGDRDLSGFKGISFDVSAFTGPTSNGAGVPAGAMRVNFPFTGEHGTDSPYWMGTDKSSSPLTVPAGTTQHVEIAWTDVGGPYYLTQQSPAVTPPPFDVTKAQSIQFQVTTTANATTPYAFCVANLALIPSKQSK